MVPKIGPQVAWQIVDGEAIVIDLASGITIGLNPTGTFLWSQIDGARDAESLAAAMAGEFDITHDEARRDTETFLGEMTRRALLVDGDAA